MENRLPGANVKANTREELVKVIGTGAPEVLTIHFSAPELGVLREELHDLRATVTRSAHLAH